MKFILEFDETEAYEHEIACKSLDVLILIDALDSELRSGVNGIGKFEKCDQDTLEKVRDWVWEQRSEKNIPELK